MLTGTEMYIALLRDWQMLSHEQVAFVNSAPSSESLHLSTQHDPPVSSTLCQRILFLWSLCHNNEVSPLEAKGGLKSFVFDRLLMVF